MDGTFANVCALITSISSVVFVIATSIQYWITSDVFSVVLACVRKSKKI
jgi:hypothetical protein